MRRHPTTAELEAFLLSQHEGAERNAIAAHLLRGCQACRERLAPLAAALLGPGLAEAPDDGGRYDMAIRRAERSVFNRLLAEERKVQHDGVGTVLRHGAAPKVARRQDEAQFRRCLEALEEIRALRHSNPQAMLTLAIANAAVCDLIDPAALPPGVVRDLQARAYAELGNARRVMNDFPRAGADFAAAAARARLGTRDPLLEAELLDKAASLFRATLHFREAAQLLDRAFEIYWSLRERHLAGRTLIKKGITEGYNGAAAEAVDLLGRGIALLDRGRDPELFLAGVQSLIWFQVDNGQLAEGRELIRVHSDLYRQHGQAIMQLRLRWVEGRIAAGLDESFEAESAFLEARAGFARHGLTYMEALVSLDLAALWLRSGRTSEVKAMLEEVLGTFRALRIRREAITTLLMLHEAAQAEQLSFTLLRAAAAKLRQFEGAEGRGPAAGR